ncbi:hypothetical protein D6779_11450, partial [Candidatus Parcubacteria bacterium]
LTTFAVERGVIMSDNILVIHPIDPQAVVDNLSHFISMLQQTEFIGEPFEWYGEIHYYPGRLFLKWITFLSSHTVICVDGSQSVEGALKVDSRQDCHIHFPEPHPEPEFLGGANVVSPRCPRCFYMYEGDSLDIVSAWYDDKKGFVWRCPSCHNTFRIYELDWRKNGSFGRQQIRIWGIWVGEALPSDSFLHLLKSITQLDWTYCYYHL